ncbi:MAG: LysR family transcriptional regulator [Pseudomonadota bacterium]
MPASISSLDWEDVKCFQAVAETGTLRTAALQLGVHHSTISRRVENLERTIRTRLLERTPDGYMLTSAGEEILIAARTFSTSLTDADRRIAGRDDEMEGQIKITLSRPLAISVIAPRLAEFTRAYPKLDVHLHTGFNLLDLSRREADVAVRMDNQPDPDLVGKRLYSYCETAYATPDYLESNPPSVSPTKARWIGWKTETSPYPDWTRDTEFPRIPVWGCFPDPALQNAAARAGLGIAMLPCLLGDVDPELVRATTKAPRPSRDIWLLTHKDLRRVARVRAFLTFAERILRDARPLLIGETPRT